MELKDDDFAALDRIATAVYATSEAKGWHTDEAYRALVEHALEQAKGAELPKAVQDLIVESEKRTRLANGVNLPERLMLIVTEAAEAMEELRNAHVDPQKTYTVADPREGETKPAYFDYVEGTKPEGVGSEMADIVIRVLVDCKRAGIDIATEIKRKARYNATRAFRHGGKRA
jgi:NTP pyrophosphatase (non-canonical NTP hydrolase)